MSTFSRDIAEGCGEGTAQVYRGSVSFIVVTSQSAYAVTVARIVLDVLLASGVESRWSCGGNLDVVLGVVKSVLASSHGLLSL